MSFPTFDPFKRKRFQKPNLTADQLTMKTIAVFLTTSKGWLVRQGLKYSGMGFAAFSASVQAKAVTLNLPIDQVQAVLTPGEAMVSALVVLTVEGVLSFLARKNA